LLYYVWRVAIGFQDVLNCELSVTLIVEKFIFEVMLDELAPVLGMASTETSLESDAIAVVRIAKLFRGTIFAGIALGGEPGQREDLLRAFWSTT